MKRTDELPDTPLPPLLPDFAALLERNDQCSYIHELSRLGLSWLFEFAIPLLAAHCAPLRQFSSELPAAPRGRLLLLALAPTEELSLAELEKIYQTCIDTDDLEAACGCIGLALQGITDSGRDFTRFHSWLNKADSLGVDSSISPLARAYLLFQCGCAELVGPGDIQHAHDLLAPVRHLAEQAGSPTLVLLHAALIAHIYFWRADLAALELLLIDVEPFLAEPQTSPPATLQYLSSLALLQTLQGNPEESRKLHKQIFNSPVLPLLPPGQWLLIQGNYLYTLAILADLDGVKRVGTAMRAKVVPEYNRYYQSYLHFNLGIVALVAGRPHKAMLHALETRRYGEYCASANSGRMAALLIGQALMDLDRDGEALDHFRQWLPVWRKAGYHILAALGSIETGYIFLRRGQTSQARSALQEAKLCVPKNERIPTLYRPREYAAGLEERLKMDCRVCHPDPAGLPVAVTTLGKFFVTVQDKRLLDDRDWYGPSVKDLLKAIIALGGSRIPTERLAELLWPDADGDQAMNSFKVTLSRLRDSVAGHDRRLRRFVVVRRKHISLTASLCFVDAFHLQGLFQRLNAGIPDPEALQSALADYRGNFLADSSDFWIIRARDELRDLFIGTTLRLCDCLLEQGAAAKTLPLLSRGLDFDPLNETLYARLMQGYLQSGNRAKALEVYRKALTTLERELDLTPGRELIALYRQLRKN